MRKNVLAIMLWLLAAMLLLLPIGVCVCNGLGYTFTLRSPTAFAVSVAVLSVTAAIVGLAAKPAVDKATTMVAALLTPLSVIYSFFVIIAVFEGTITDRMVVALCCLISITGCGITTIRLGGWSAIKTIAPLALSVVMIFPLFWIGAATVLIGSLGKDTVVRMVPSPDGRYYAQVIDSDQGALGGDTLVVVYDTARFGLDAGLFTIKPKSTLIYRGEWGEFERMTVKWKDEHHLIVHSREYEIP